MSKAGRKCRLTPERQRKITKLIRAGHYKEVAARASGIGERTFYTWYEKGAPGHPETRRKYQQFRQAVDAAEAESEEILLKTILREGGAKGALEVLKRRFPNRWGDRHRLEHTGDPDAPIGVHHTGEITMTPAVTIVIADPEDVWQESDDPGEKPAAAIETETQLLPMPGETKLEHDESGINDG